MIRKILKLSLLITCSFVWGAESDLYDFSWLDKDKEVYVLQNRKFKKKGRFSMSAGYGKTTSGAFVDASAIQGRIGYFFTEEFGFEGIYSKNSGTENDTAASVRSSGSGSGTIPFRRIVDGYYGGMLLWAPFYTQINTFNSIIYLDFIFGLGAVTIEETNNRAQFDTFDSTAADVKESHSGVIWNFGTKFFVNETWNIRFDINGVHYQAKKALANSTEDAWYENIDMTLALGIDI